MSYKCLIIIFYLTFNTDLIFLHVSVSLVESGRVEAAVKTADITNSVLACDVIRQTCNYTDTVFSKSVATDNGRVYSLVELI